MKDESLRVEANSDISNKDSAENQYFNSHKLRRLLLRPKQRIAFQNNLKVLLECTQDLATVLLHDDPLKPGDHRSEVQIDPRRKKKTLGI